MVKNYLLGHNNPCKYCIQGYFRFDFVIIAVLLLQTVLHRLKFAETRFSIKEMRHWNSTSFIKDRDNVGERGKTEIEANTPHTHIVYSILDLKF